MKKIGRWTQRDVVFACLMLLLFIAGLVLHDDFLYGGGIGCVALAVIWYMGRGPGGNPRTSDKIEKGWPFQ